MPISIPESLAASCAETAERTRWLDSLPALVQEIAERWSLSLGQPIDGDEVSCSWVASVRRSNGSSAMLKIGMPHMEGEHETDKGR